MTGHENHRSSPPWSPDAFERRFAAHPDPWCFATAPHERRRYARTVAALGRQRYARALELGCAIGELTALLAPRCDALLATDVSPTALARARDRCPSSNVRFLASDLGEEAPEGPFDLVVLSEVGYYFTRPALRRIARRLVIRLADGGELVAVHWLGRSDDHRLHGDDVHAVLGAAPELALRRSQRLDGHRLDVWERR